MKGRRDEETKGKKTKVKDIYEWMLFFIYTELKTKSFNNFTLQSFG